MFHFIQENYRCVPYFFIFFGGKDGLNEYLPFTLGVLGVLAVLKKITAKEYQSFFLYPFYPAYPVLLSKLFSFCRRRRPKSAGG